MVSRGYKKVFFSEGKLLEESYAYMHLQKRNMSFDLAILSKDRFQIVANKFIVFNGLEITESNFKDICFTCFNLQYWNSILKPKILRLLSKL